MLAVMTSSEVYGHILRKVKGRITVIRKCYVTLLLFIYVGKLKFWIKCSIDMIILRFTNIGILQITFMKLQL